MATDIIIDNLSCFLISGRDDFSIDKLTDIAYTFYSHEEVKISKEKIFNIINKDIVCRRDPEKKKKDLNDLIDGLNELKDKNKRIKMVSDSYKKMPPVGLEFIAPILLDLSEEISKINSILPSILDIKSTVLNTADTVRDYKIDLMNLKQVLNSNDQNIATSVKRNSITPNKIQPIIENKIKSLRQNGINDIVSPDCVSDVTIKNVNCNSDVNSNIKAINKMATDSRNCSRATMGQAAGEQATPASQATGSKATVKQATPSIAVDSASTGNTIKSNFSDINKCGTISSPSELEMHNNIDNISRLISNNLLTPDITSMNSNLEIEDGDNDNCWTLVDCRRRNSIKTRPKFSKSITGVKNSPNNKFKSASRTLDLYVGRVDNDVVDDDIITYVVNNFKINPIKIEQLQIRATNYAAFKLTINSNDRDSLLCPDKWPVGIIVNKYYNKNN